MPHQVFFDGRVRSSALAATALLAVSRVARTRFYVPPGMLAHRLREADPVFTVAKERLRVESFSACCSAYARFDLLPEAIDGTIRTNGTINVDFNPAMRSELAKVRSADVLRLSVGSDAVTAKRSHADTVVERKVALPTRWFRGFVESQIIQSKMTKRFEIDATDARRFLRSVPNLNPKEALFVIPAGKGLRISARSANDAVAVGGIARLHVLDELCRRATELTVFADVAGNSGWQLTFDNSRFFLVLTANIWRGFSGEGTVLAALATQAWADRVPHLRAALKWQTCISARDIATVLHAEEIRVCIEHAIAYDDPACAPRDVHALLSLLRELCVEAKCGVEYTGTRDFLKVQTGSSKAAKLSQALLRLDGESVHREAATRLALDGRLPRALRWQGNASKRSSEA